jgi:hypothetical protein
MAQMINIHPMIVGASNKDIIMAEESRIVGDETIV